MLNRVVLVDLEEDEQPVSKTKINPSISNLGFEKNFMEAINFRLLEWKRRPAAFYERK